MGNTVKGKRADSGQTVIESVFMVIFLLILFFFIAEFARAWYLKNSLNNAVRVSVRQAAVTPGLTAGTTIASCDTLPGGDIGDIMDAVCSSPGVPDSVDTQVAVIRVDDEAPSGFGSGDTVTVEARSEFRGIALGFVLPDSAASSASMRYE